jgi:hypothetical protein
VACVTYGFTLSDEFALASVNNSNFRELTVRRFPSAVRREPVIIAAYR